MNKDDLWQRAYDEALQRLNLTEEDVKKQPPGIDTSQLTEFVNEYVARYPSLEEHERISRVVTVAAYVLASGYPAEDVRKLFAAFCVALISYGRDLEE